MTWEKKKAVNKALSDIPRGSGCFRRIDSRHSRLCFLDGRSISFRSFAAWMLQTSQRYFKVMVCSSNGPLSRGSKQAFWVGRPVSDNRSGWTCDYTNTRAARPPGTQLLFEQQRSEVEISPNPHLTTTMAALLHVNILPVWEKQDLESSRLFFLNANECEQGRRQSRGIIWSNGNNSSDSASDAAEQLFLDSVKRSQFMRKPRRQISEDS